MSKNPWWDHDPPWLQVVPDESLIPARQALPPSGSIYAARMHGGEMGDVDGVFSQFYETFKLPDYFGWNWNALYDCLSDLNWISATRYLLIIEDSEKILSGYPEERSEFFRTLLRSAEDWARRPNFPGRTRSAFHALFLCSSEACDALKREIGRAPGSE
ncbi:barstar family protein [Streptomyces sp. NPDC023723]|uniref:barstar family protein n=1 Tax=Streptomyces sp. NPDC023723 TaxID=3154323 RepID=UPI0033C39CC6